jgi:hypothetical protein
VLKGTGGREKLPFYLLIISARVHLLPYSAVVLRRSTTIFLQAFLDTDSSRAIWLLFLDTKTSLEQFFTDINIPFDCQFLVAQPQNDHVVMLTEVYRVSPTLPLQTYCFGNWTAGDGLTWPSQGLYRRRNNLKGFTIQATRLNVRGNL